MLTCCADYRLTRRTLMGAAAGTFLGFHVRNLLAFADTGKATAEHVILFWNGGGMSHIDTWDPKPGRPTQGDFDADQDRRGRDPDFGDLPRVRQADEARGPDPLHRRHQRRPWPGHLPAPDQLPTEPQPAAPRHRLRRGFPEARPRRPAGLHHHQRSGAEGWLPGPEVRGLLRRPARREGPVPVVPGRHRPGPRQQTPRNPRAHQQTPGREPAPGRDGRRPDRRQATLSG